MRRIIASAVTAFAVTASIFAASPAQAKEADITGQGSSFALNFITKCATQYKAKTQSVVNYTGPGSGAGRSAFAKGEVDFAGSDTSYGSSETKPASYVQVPVVGGPVAIVYNVAGVKNLKLNAKTLGGIFKGDIKTWNDPAIVAMNKSAKLPSDAIVVAYRSKDSGTTANVQDYLIANGVSIAAGKKWNGAQGVGVADSSAMASTVKSTAFAIGYVDLSDVSVKVSKAAITNGAGKYIKPTAAAAKKFLSKQTFNSDGTVTINWTQKISGAYNLSIVTYMMIPKGAGTEKAKAASAFAQFALDTCGKKPAAGYTGFSGKNLKTALALAKSGS